MPITKKQMQAYEKVRQSGVTNMFAINTVANLTGLNKEAILDIMGNYDTYIEKFNIDRGE